MGPNLKLTKIEKTLKQFLCRFKLGQAFHYIKGFKFILKTTFDNQHLLHDFLRFSKDSKASVDLFAFILRFEPFVAWFLRLE